MVLGSFRGHKNTVTCCAISANGKLAVSSSEDNTVKVGGGIGIHVHVHVMCRYGIITLSSTFHQVDWICNLIVFFLLSFFFSFFLFFFLFSLFQAEG